MLKRLLMVAAPVMLLSACDETTTQPTVLSGEEPVAFAHMDKVDVCHARGDGGWNHINIAASALPAHRAHGDGQPGEGVPGMDGSVFVLDCEIVVGTITTLRVEPFIGGDYLDLETGKLCACNERPSLLFWDIVFERIRSGPYEGAIVLIHADPNLPQTGPATNQAEIVHLRGRPYGGVTAADVDRAAFTEEQILEPFDGTRTILIRTFTGNVYKIGYISEAPRRVTFVYQLLIEATPV